jgi:hypothetical protein
MYNVFWIDGALPQAREFNDAQLSDALGFAETLRRRQRAGENVGFVTIASENPDSVGQGGVGDPPADYDWTKRRTLARGRAIAR